MSSSNDIRAMSRSSNLKEPVPRFLPRQFRVSFFNGDDNHWKYTGQGTAAGETADYVYSRILASHREGRLEVKSDEPGSSRRLPDTLMSSLRKSAVV